LGKLTKPGWGNKSVAITQVQNLASKYPNQEAAIKSQLKQRGWKDDDIADIMIEAGVENVAAPSEPSAPEQDESSELQGLPAGRYRIGSGIVHWDGQSIINRE